MKAATLRPTLERIGCWPPICHACDKPIPFEAHVAFYRANAMDKGRALLAVIHEGCVGRPVREPTPESARAPEGRA